MNPNFQWDPNKYNGLDIIHFPTWEIWKPDFHVYNRYHRLLYVLSTIQILIPPFVIVVFQRQQGGHRGIFTNIAFTVQHWNSKMETVF